jgi:hypothetical protein
MNSVREIKRKVAGLWGRRLGRLTLGLVVVALLAATFGGLTEPNGSSNTVLAGPGGAQGNDRLPGTEEFGLSKRELVKSIGLSNS